MAGCTRGEEKGSHRTSRPTKENGWFSRFSIWGILLSSNHVLATTGKSCANKKVPYSKINISLLANFGSFFWEQRILSLMSQITCVLYQILLAWLFKSCGDRAPIPLKNSEIVDKRNNKQQNVKISGNILVQLYRFLHQL